MYRISEKIGICRWDWEVEGTESRFSQAQAMGRVSSVARGGSLAVLRDGEMVA